MWCSAADTHLKLLDQVVSGASFLTMCVLECHIAHRRSVAVLCMLYKFRCNQMHSFYGVLPGPCVPVRVMYHAFVPRRFTYWPSRCKTSQYCKTFILLSVSLWNDLGDHIHCGVGLAGFKSRANAHLLPLLHAPFCLILLSLSLRLQGWGLRTDSMLIIPYQPSIANCF